MSRKPFNHNESWENDAVWKLLDQAPPATAGPRFLEHTLRAARLTDQVVRPWWKLLFAPAPLAGLTAATAALAITVVSWTGYTPEPGEPTSAFHSRQAAEIQDIAESETLIAAADQLDDFSDTELVSLIGF